MPVRILLAELNRLPRDVIERSVATRPELELVGVVHEGEDLATRVAETTATLVLVGLPTAPDDDEAALLHRYDDLLFRHPRLRVLALADSERQAILYTLRPDRRTVTEVYRARGLAEVIHCVTSEAIQ